ncbi:MAG TPA: hypothetical protein PLK63_15560 [Catalimonadaceae bacterium]|nr:hypothetical protein [Catalimonadaceae bacterium]
MKSIRTKILLLFAAISALCCVDYYGDWNEFQSYFNPESTGLKQEFRPFFYAPNSAFYDFYDGWYDYGESVQKPEEDIHVKAWAAWLGAGFTEHEIDRTLYSDSVSPSFLNRVKKKSPEGYSYLMFLQSTTEFLDRLEVDDWEEKPAQDLQTIESNLKTATERSLQSADPFLKERYGYLAVKLAWQLPDPKRAIGIFDKLIEPLTQKTYISEWAKGRVATSYAKNGQKDRALYEFAMMFRDCPSRRQDAISSARFLRLSFSETALSFAKNNQEKEAVFAFLGVLPFTDNLPYAVRLADLNPQHPMLRLVIAREINRTEMFTSLKGDPYPYYESPEDSLRQINGILNTPDYQEKLKNFAREMAARTKDRDQAFWLTAQSYLHHLRGENGKALTLVEKARQIPEPGDALANQMVAQELLILSKTETWMYPELESRMVRLLDAVRSDLSFYQINARNAALLRIADLYEKQHVKEDDKGWWNWSCQPKKAMGIPAINQVKAFVLRATTAKSQSENAWHYFSETSLEELCNGMTAQQMQFVLDMVVKSNKSEIEAKLLAMSQISKLDVIEWTARRYMAEQQYSKAQALFAQLPETIFEVGNFEPYTHFRNPFWVRMPFDTAANPKTPTQFAAEMVKLEALTKTAKGDDLAYAYYLLGCGEFNLSKEGTAWICVKASHSWYDSDNMVPLTDLKNKKPGTAERYLQNNYITTAKALEYFEKSVSAAVDNDLKARSMYMAARCLMNRQMAEARIEIAKTGTFEFGYFYIDSDVWKPKIKSLLATNKWIKSLQNFAPQTRFHQIMIRECSLYNDYFGENSESVFF